MNVAEIYSHLNGQEHILVHKPHLWGEIKSVIETVDAGICRTKVSAEKRTPGKMLYSPRAFNDAFKRGFNKLDWEESRTSYWVTADQELVRKTMTLSPETQKEAIIAAGKTPIFSYNQTDFVKDRIAVEVQFGKYSFVAYDLFVKHMAFYIGNVIDVGIEILPMKALSAEMSSGVSYYEGELYNVLRHGRGTPAVLLVLIGVSP
ncbi:BglII/BstYI family type II restriction endonuclease [Caldilinea sp.]|uniref:BglII/BstYI family type II restriction endonuclease n=1 Tax=Caldilinea sp. TaxID=2293560 RepID=UPI003135103D|nr:restriction endonuclease [Anaerolineales bacterium]